MDFRPGSWLVHTSMFDFVSLLAHWIKSGMLKWFVIKCQSDSWNSFDTGFTNLQLSLFIWISKDLWQQISSYENWAKVKESFVLLV